MACFGCGGTVTGPATVLSRVVSNPNLQIPANSTCQSQKFSINQRLISKSGCGSSHRAASARLCLPARPLKQRLGASSRVGKWDTRVVAKATKNAESPSIPTTTADSTLDSVRQNPTRDVQAEIMMKPTTQNLSAERDAVQLVRDGESGAPLHSDVQQLQAGGEFLNGLEGAGGVLAGGAVTLLVAMIGLGWYFREPINSNLEALTSYLETLGPMGYVVYMLAYVVLEVLAIPALPLTMSGGVLFGVQGGTLAASTAATLGATISFLIARYFARDKVMAIAKGNPTFTAIDKAIGADSLRVVLLLRLSPLLPLSLSNYLYGLTSVELGPYVLASWLGMLPGTWAYVTAGDVSRNVIQAGTEGGGFDTSNWLALGAGVAFTLLAGGYLSTVAQKALSNLDVDIDL